MTTFRPLARHALSRPLVGVLLGVCLLVGACTPSPPFDVRPTSQGLDAVAGVANPYVDGKQLLAADRPGLAIERFRQALARDKSSLEALNGLAVAYARLGRTGPAETYLLRALDIRHDDPATLNNYGRLLLDQGRTREAEPFLDLALQHSEGPEATVVRMNLARLGVYPTLITKRWPQQASGPRLVRTDTAAYRLEVAPAETPQAPLAPPAAKPEPAAAPAETIWLDPRVVLANGAGQSGLAARWRERFEAEGVPVLDVGDARPFGRRTTEIRHHPYFAPEARHIAGLFPEPVRLVADANATGDVYVVLGRDSVNYLQGEAL